MSEDGSLNTRETLLLRLRDSADDAAWREFVEIYSPLLCRYCQKRGLPDADVADVVQQVMRSVAVAMKNFEYDPVKGKFKGWLFTALRRTLGNHFKAQAKRPLTAADTQMLRRLEETPDEGEVNDWELDYQRELLAWAMEKVKPEFAVRIWSAFERTAVQGQEPAAVAAEIGMSKNSVAVAKHRVMTRLREKARSVDAERWEGEIIAELRKG